MSLGVLIGGFTGGDREQTVVMYLDQFTHRVVIGGEEVTGESDRMISTGLWSDDSSFRFTSSQCSNWKKKLRTDGDFSSKNTVP